MTCPSERQSKQYSLYKAEIDRMLKQYDHAYGSGKPPAFERKSHVDSILTTSKRKPRV